MNDDETIPDNPLTKAWVLTLKALEEIGAAWERNPRCRTARLTEACNLLERAKGKLAAEGQVWHEE